MTDDDLGLSSILSGITGADREVVTSAAACLRRRDRPAFYEAVRQALGARL